MAYILHTMNNELNGDEGGSYENMNDKIAETTQRMLEGKLSAKEQEELALRVKADTKLGDRLEEQASIDALLHGFFGRSKSEAAWSAVSRGVSGRSRRGLGWRLAGLLSWPRLAVAGGACLLLVFWLTLDPLKQFLKPSGAAGNSLAAIASARDGLTVPARTGAGVVARVVAFSGELLLDGEVVAASSEMKLTLGTKLRTAPDAGIAQLELADGRGVLRLAPDSKLMLIRDASSALVVRLLRGEVEVMASAEGTLPVVTSVTRIQGDAAHYRISVVRYAAEKGSLGLSEVSGELALLLVVAGTVDLRNDAGVLGVGAGQVAWCAAGQRPALLGECSEF